MNRMWLAAILCAAVGMPAVAADGNGTTYGAGVKLTSSVTVADLLARPAEFVGKTVRVDGVISAVCQEMGCWIQLADDEKGQPIQFKVDDGVIVFPKDGKGHRASAEGTFEEIPSGDAHDAERAKESGGASEPPGAAQRPTYRVRATGAVIY